MNIALFEQKKPELKTLIGQWFADNVPLSEDEIAIVSVAIKNRPPKEAIELNLVSEGPITEGLDRELSVRILDVDFGRCSIRIVSRFSRVGFVTIGQLARSRESDLRKYHGIGTKSLIGLREYLEARGLRLECPYPIGPLEQAMIDQHKTKQ